MSIDQYIVIISVGAAVLLVAGFCLRSFTFRNVMMACVLAVFAYVQFYLLLVDSGYILTVPWLLFTNTTVAVYAGPAIYFLSLSITENKEALTRSDCKYLVPVIVISAASMYYALQPVHVKLLILSEMSQRLTFYHFMTTPNLLIFPIFLVMSLVNLYRHRRRGNFVHARLLMLMYFFFSWFAVIIIRIAALILQNDAFLRVSNIFGAAVIFALFLYSQKYPNLLQYLSTAAGKNEKEYAKSHLDKIDMQTLDRLVKELMEKERFYCDEELSLARLSEALEITPHQLSQFLNSCYGMNFNSFVNNYRIDEAKRLLIERPLRNTLVIAYSVGFNSYTAFYTSFKRQNNCSPAEFRKRNLD